MENIFGVPVTTIMVVLLVTFVLCLSVGGWIWLRHRVIFRMGVRNIPRRPAQTVLIVIGLMLSTLIIAAALTTGDTLNYSIKSEVYRLLGHTDELVVLASADGDGGTAGFGAANAAGGGASGPQIGVTFPQEVATDLQAALAGHPDIAGMLPILSEPVPAINMNTNLSEPVLAMTGIEPGQLEGFAGFEDINGNAIDFAVLPEDGVVLGEKPAEMMDASVGDVITIYAANQPHQLTVAAIAPDSFLTGMSEPGLPGGLAMPLEHAQELLGRAGEISYIAVSNVGSVETSVDRSDAVVQALNAELAGTDYRAVAVKENSLALAEMAGNTFTSVFLVLGLFSIAAGILLIFLIFVLLAAERKPEMGMARAVGLKRSQLTQMFLAEGIAYDLVSALVGAALGVGVAFVMAGVLAGIFGEALAIRPTASWPSLVIAYTLGVVVTFLTILVSSWRVSKLNIVAAIRDTPEPAMPRAGRRWLIFGILGIVLGGLMLWGGARSESLFLYSFGMSLIPFSAAMVLRRFGVPARLVYSLASALVLTYWLLPESLFNEIFPTLDGDIEMFFVSGIMMVTASTILIIWNAEILTGLVGVLGRTFSRWLPAVKTAVAYPLATKGRTGMTIAMFALIVFSLVTIATINVNLSALFTSGNAAAGWQVSASQSPANPIDDLEQTLQENGVDTSPITAIGQVESVPGFRTQVRMVGAQDWQTYPVLGADDSFIEHSNMSLQIRADGYDSDQAVWDAIQSNPDLAVVDGFAIFTQGFGSDPSMNFRLQGVRQGDRNMEPRQVEIRDPASGKSRDVTVIGVVDGEITWFTGVITNEQTFGQIFPEPSAITFYAQLTPDADPVDVSRAIESNLLTFGVTAISIDAQIEEMARESQGALYLIEGFMALGLLVGIAALGVISFRSVVERRQQIGMLRAIGYQRGMVSASFLIESSMITFLGVTSGAILGLILSWQLMTSEEFTGATGGDISFIVPWGMITLFLGIAIGASLLMAYIPARQAARVPIADALRYE